MTYLFAAALLALLTLAAAAAALAHVAHRLRGLNIPRAAEF